MKLNKKAFFKGVKALSLIIVLLFTFSFSLGIRGNKPRLMANRQTTISAVIPNSGYLGNVYFNKTIPEGINEIFTNIQYLDLSNLGVGFTSTMLAYVIATNSSFSKAIISWKDISLPDYTVYGLSIIGYGFDNTNIYNTHNGWNTEFTSDYISFNDELLTSYQGLTIGNQNILLTALISTVDFSNNAGYQDGYDDGYEVGYEEGYQDGYDAGYEEGDENGYRNGYDFGLLTGQQNGEEIGYQNGYIDGQQYGEQVGYNVGYQQGYNDGRLEESPIGLEWFKSAISVLNSFLDIQLLPNVSIGAILSGFVILVLLKWILAWFRG